MSAQTSPRIDCPLCHGEGSVEHTLPGGYFDSYQEAFYPLEQTKKCDLCKGSGSVDTPQHENTFNLTPQYAQLKEIRTSKRSSTNAVAVAYICGVSVEEIEQSQANPNHNEMKRAA